LLTTPLTGLLLVTGELGVQPGERLVQMAGGSTVGKVVLELGR
jgi:NADPH:quinone reductase-like Zn-dependent oxidoreductase